MKKVNETAKSEKVQELLKNKVVIYRKDLIALELSDYEIKKLVSNGVIKKIGHGSYTSSKSQENYLPKSNLEEVKKAFLEQDEEALYKSFQNLELNEEAIKTLYPLLLSGLIKLQKEVEKLNNSKCFAQPQENIIVPPTKKEQQEEKQEPLSTHKDVIKDHPPIIESKKEQQEEKTEVIQEKTYTEEYLDNAYYTYQDAIIKRDYERAHQYIKIYIEGCQALHIIGDYYYQLFGIEKKLYEKNYSKETLKERRILENKVKDFIRKNQPDEASKYYYELLKLDQEKNPYYDFYYIEILKEKRNYRQALEVAKRLCENFETYARSYYELALVQFFTRRELDAIKTLKTYFKYDMGEHAKGDSLLISCYINLGKYEKAEQALLEAENYLRPELLPDLYKKVWNNRQKSIDYLKEKLSTEIPPFLLNKYQERYHNCQNAFEKLGAITEVDYEQLYLENDKKTPYLHTFKDILEESKNTEAITAYINSLDLDQQEKMSIQLTATEFFAQEKLYSASQKCLTHVEQFDKKDSLLKRQVENTKKQIKVIKAQNK